MNFDHKNAPGNGVQNPEDRKLKFQRKLARFEEVYNTVNKVHKLGFRTLVLVFVLLVEVALFVTVFGDFEMNGAEATAIIIVAVLPILVMRAFDLTTLNLTKEGFASTMAQNGEVLPFKFSEKAPVNVVVKTDKYFQIECDGKTYKLAIVEEVQTTKQVQ